MDKIMKKYKMLEEKGRLFPSDGDPEVDGIVVSPDAWKKIVTVAYLFESFLDQTDKYPYYSQWVRETFRREYGMNWWQLKPENMQAMFDKMTLDPELRPRSRWFYDKFAKLVGRVRFLPGPPFLPCKIKKAIVHLR